MKYNLIRSNRKTLAIYIKNGEVQVRAPLKMTDDVIEKFVLSKENWIVTKVSQSNERKLQRESFALNYGSLILYRGKEYPIVLSEKNRAGFDGERFFMPPGLTPEQIKTACIKLYLILAKQHLTERTHLLSKQMLSAPNTIKINGAKTRWGSCSSKKNINYSWRIIMADDEIIDYIIVHELAHLTEMNHSKKFWAVVASVLPNYRELNKKLKNFNAISLLYL